MGGSVTYYIILDGMCIFFGRSGLFEFSTLLHMFPLLGFFFDSFPTTSFVFAGSWGLVRLYMSPCGRRQPPTVKTGLLLGKAKRIAEHC